MSLEQTLSELSTSDRAMKVAAIGDLDLLTASLERRTELVRAAAGAIERLRQDAQQPPAATREILEQCTRDGMHTMRQIILARHMLTTELGGLKRERRLLEALAGDRQQLGSRIEIQA